MMKKTRKHQQYKKQTKSKTKTKTKSRRRPLKQPFKKIQCGPQQDGDNNFSCYSNRSIEKMKNLWNVRHPDKKILTNNTREIWESLKKYMLRVQNLKQRKLL